MLLSVLSNHAAKQPKKIALNGANTQISYEAIFCHLETIKSALTHCNCLAILLDNHPAWVLLDLAALDLNLPIVPLPMFFTPAQCLHAMQDAGVDCLITDRPTQVAEYAGAYITSQNVLHVADLDLTLIQLNFAKKSLPKNTAKITYTSGTTGAPKGVCLSAKAMLNVANSVKTVANVGENDQHLCVLPLSTLLENVAGIYTTLLAGATAHVLPAEMIGLNGSQLNVQKLYVALANTQASTAIFIPELLNALVSYIENGAAQLPHLRFLAVGGAHVAPQLLQRATAINLPVFEGYGLSECASVVALNGFANSGSKLNSFTIQDSKLNSFELPKIGSIGKPLPHVAINIADDGEILVNGAQFLGYVGNAQPKNQGDWLATGDIGFVDENGFLFINGRKKNMFITSFGRNVSPEWVECELTSQAEILQACVFGEAQPFNIAIVVSTAQLSVIEAAIAKTNLALPDYAKIGKWLLVEECFSNKNQQLTTNGRLKRDAILQHYQAQINTLYEG
jgi:long-chain acyl-CoA synthetase